MKISLLVIALISLLFIPIIGSAFSGITGVMPPGSEGDSSKQRFDIAFRLSDSVLYNSDDLMVWITFESFGIEPIPAKLEFTILNVTGDEVYHEEEQIVVQTELTIGKSFENAKLDVGGYTLVLKTTYNTDFEDELRREFKIREPRKLFGFIPLQLFDIKLEIENTAMDNINDLSAWITFESFGTEPTPINLTYILLDGRGGEIHREETSTIVETEEFLIKDFEGIESEPGKYTLILRTLYNNSVEDEFRQEFEVKEKDIGWLIYALGGIVILFAVYMMRRLGRKEQTKGRGKRRR